MPRFHVIANKPAIDSNFKPATISHNDFVINTNILIDTGALQSNYVNEIVAMRLEGKGLGGGGLGCRLG
jgi:hypothetical protein